MIAGPQADLARRIAAGLGGVVAALALGATARRDLEVVSLPLALLAAAALLIHLGSFGAQLFARAVWWSNLALGTVLACVAGRSERGYGVLMAIGCGAALLVIGRKGLAEASERSAYAPAALRSWLLLLMVFALADAQTFLLFAVVSLREHRLGEGLILTAAGIGYVAGFVGLYRLQIWGAILSAVTSMLVLAVLWTGELRLPNDLRTFLGVVSVVHLAVVVPMLAVVLGRVRVPTFPPRARALGASVVIAGLMTGSVVSFLVQAR